MGVGARQAGRLAISARLLEGKLGRFCHPTITADALADATAPRGFGATTGADVAAVLRSAFGLALSDGNDGDG
eukprot:SAG11_NODE_28900_length_316_cov_0.958525_1_plen_72_part_10